MKRKTDHRIVSSYLHNVYHVNVFAKLINKATKQLKAFRQKHPFDAIAFTGTSGAALAYPLSLRLKVPLICVRNPLIKNHSNHMVEGCYSAKRYIIIDDLIDVGNTIKRIVDGINIAYKVERAATKPKLIAIWLYGSDTSYRKWKGTPVHRITS